MPAVSITPDDLAPFADIDLDKALAMIEDALALAARVAPCIRDDAFEHDVAAKAIIRRAILRWNESGTGVVTQRQQTAGSFSSGESYDRQTSRGTFWPSEINDLARLCADWNKGKAYEVDTGPRSPADGFWQHPDVWVPL